MSVARRYEGCSFAFGPITAHGFRKRENRRKEMLIFKIIQVISLTLVRIHFQVRHPRINTLFDLHSVGFLMTTTKKNGDSTNQ